MQSLECWSVRPSVLDRKAVPYSLRRLACNPYGRLAGLSSGLGVLLVTYGG